MILKYNDFIKEGSIHIKGINVIDGITIKQHEILKKFGITDYKLNKETNLIDVFQEVRIQFKKLTELPDIRLGIIYGNYLCSRNELTSLKNCPIEIYGEFYCGGNKLTSFEYCPRYVNGSFVCNDNPLSSIEDYPLCIIDENITNMDPWENDKIYPIVCDIVKSNEEIFKNLLDDKIKFHQMIMRIEPSLVKYYKNITPPSKNSTLLL